MNIQRSYILTVVFVLIIVAIIVGLLLFLQKKEKQQEQESEQTLEALLKHAEDNLKASRELDSDGDGLSDQAEVVAYHTDPSLADTDGDGFSDGDEVARGFDPRIHSKEGDRIVPLLNDPLDENNISNQLIARLDQTVNKDGITELGPDEINQLVALHLNDVDTSLSIPEIKPSDLRLSSDTSTAAVQKYFSSSSPSMETVTGVISTNNGMDAILELAQRGDNDSLDILIASTNKAYIELQEMTVPNTEEFIALHTTNMNLLVLIKTVFEELKFVSTDPMRSALSSKYTQDALSLAQENTARLTALREQYNIPAE